MAAPQTGWEANGAFTTHAEETAFLAQIAADTGAVVSTAGTSANGTTLNRLDIGTDVDGTWLIVAMQHGNECAPREGVLAFIRDLAYSTDPATVEYLSRHRIVLLAGVNPDGFPTSRYNGNGQDINRGHYLVLQPEAVAIAKAIRNTGAALVMDVHGRDDLTSSNDWEFAVTGVQSAHSGLLSMGAELQAYMQDEAAGHGYSTAIYPDTAPGSGSLRNVTAAHHALCLLSETWGPGGTDARITVTRNILESARQWHETESGALASMRAASKAVAQANSGPFRLETDGGVVTYDPPPTGYQMVGRTSVPARLVEAFGVTADATGLVPMGQDARWIVPVVFDPVSPAESVDSTRVGGTVWEPEPDPDPLPPVGIPVGYRVNVGGQPYDVERITLGLDGEPVVTWQA